MGRFLHLFNRTVSITVNELTNSRVNDFVYCKLTTYSCLMMLIALIIFTFNIHAMAHEMWKEANDTLVNPPIIGLAEIEIIAENPYQDFQLLSTQYGRLSKDF